MNVDGMYNVRDIGGYATASGKTIRQGLIYRGGSVMEVPDNIYYTNSITDEGKKTMSEVMGIKTEIDFRTAKESGVTLEQGSPIPNATLDYLTLNSYANVFQYDDELCELFDYLADVNSYPIYYHCTGGADRTGSVSYLLSTLLGVSNEICVQDFEITSFSYYGVRSTKSGTYSESWTKFMTQLDTYAGATRQEKVQSYLLSIGVTQAEINTFKGIMYGEIDVNATGVQPKEEAPVSAMKTMSKLCMEAVQAWAVEKKD